MSTENAYGLMAAMPILIPFYFVSFIVIVFISIIVLGEIFPSVKAYFKIKTIPSDYTQFS